MNSLTSSHNQELEQIPKVESKTFRIGNRYFKPSKEVQEAQSKLGIIRRVGTSTHTKTMVMQVKGLLITLHQVQL